MSILGSGFPTSCERRTDDIVLHWWFTGGGPVEEGTPCMCGERRYQSPDHEDDS